MPLLYQPWSAMLLSSLLVSAPFGSGVIGFSTPSLFRASSSAGGRTYTRRSRFWKHCPAGRTTSSIPSMSLPAEGGPTSRNRAIGLGVASLFSLAVAPTPGLALDPVRKVQEQLRIRAQEEFDNVEALASPEGGKTLQPVLALVPIITLRLQLDEVESNLKDPRLFGAALTILQAQDFQKKDIKRVFNAYSDNIYYLPDSDRENKYLQGGATPSSRQTLQYLLRNDVIDNVEALTAEISYLIREREVGGEADTDEKDLRMYLGKCKQSFDKYLGMVLQNEIDEATDMAKVALANKRKGNAPTPAKTL
ncbi:unnamed protein product [Ectocarpus sp. CCAP 1310/34]|nr:unnamed protein product [Ectocarpus sp. CCAP 1310/34]